MRGQPPEHLAQLARGLADAELTISLVEARRAGAGGGRPAAVLILIGDVAPGEPAIVFVEKASHLRRHAGQIAFPGGRVEAEDPGPVFAALREAQEEVGINPASVDVIGVLPSIHVRTSEFEVTAVVGHWSEPRALLPVDRDEIAAVHIIEVGQLVDPSNRVTWALPNGFAGPGFVIGPLFIWGFTANLLDGVLALAGWQQTWDSKRTRTVPRRFALGG